MRNAEDPDIDPQDNAYIRTDQNSRAIIDVDTEVGFYFKPRYQNHSYPHSKSYLKFYCKKGFYSVYTNRDHFRAYCNMNGAVNTKSGNDPSNYSPDCNGQIKTNYTMYIKYVPWQQAQRFCRSKGLELAQILSNSDIDQLNKLRISRNYTYDYTYFQTGLTGKNWNDAIWNNTGSKFTDCRPSNDILHESSGPSYGDNYKFFGVIRWDDDGDGVNWTFSWTSNSGRGDQNFTGTSNYWTLCEERDTSCGPSCAKRNFYDNIQKTANSGEDGCVPKYCSLPSEISTYLPNNSTLSGEIDFKYANFKKYFHYGSTQEALCDEGYTTDPSGENISKNITISCDENGKVVSSGKCYRIKCGEWSSAEHSSVTDEFNLLYLEDAQYLSTSSNFAHNWLRYSGYSRHSEPAVEFYLTEEAVVRVFTVYAPCSSSYYSDFDQIEVDIISENGTTVKMNPVDNFDSSYVSINCGCIENYGFGRGLNFTFDGFLNNAPFPVKTIRIRSTGDYLSARQVLAWGYKENQGISVFPDFGSYRIATCDSGFVTDPDGVLEGVNYKVECDKNGNNTFNTSPGCYPSKCENHFIPAFSDLTNTFYNYSNNYFGEFPGYHGFGTILTFTCQLGFTTDATTFTLKKEITAECDENGKWTYSHQNCWPMSCLNSGENIENYQLEYYNNTDLYKSDGNRDYKWTHPAVSHDDEFVLECAGPNTKGYMFWGNFGSTSSGNNYLRTDYTVDNAHSYMRFRPKNMSSNCDTKDCWYLRSRSHNYYFYNVYDGYSGAERIYMYSLSSHYYHNLRFVLNSDNTYSIYSSGLKRRLYCEISDYHYSHDALVMHMADCSYPYCSEYKFNLHPYETTKIKYKNV